MYARFGRRAGPGDGISRAQVGFDMGVVGGIGRLRSMRRRRGAKGDLEFIGVGRVVRAVPYLAVDTCAAGSETLLQLLAAVGTLALAGTSIVAAYTTLTASADEPTGDSMHDM
jgi:hypothetical protein